MSGNKPTVTYKYSRLTFKKDKIEPLKDDEYFRVVTHEGTFQMSKSDFYTVFKNVTESSAYKQDGLYNYVKVPQRALQYLVDNTSNVTTQKQNITGLHYSLPDFLVNQCTLQEYKKWLHRKAFAHFKRDSDRGMKNISCSSYKKAIHEAVLNGGQHDAYTGEQLNWKLISKYRNEEARVGGRQYKKKFWYLPTVDHYDNNRENPTFKICAWKTNDCKNDLTLNEFLEVCEKVLNHNKNKIK
jgi:hypothetical protein